MEAMNALLTRNSAPSLVEPAPSAAQREQILAAALRAPDHARMRPWRFLLVDGDARRRLGSACAEAALAADPGLDGQALQKLRDNPLRAPLVIVVAARLQPSPKVPEIEQLLSAGCAAHSILIASHALGYGAIWRTGNVAYLPALHEALGFAASERIVGFIYVGSVAGEPKPLPSLDIAEYLHAWP